MNWIVSNIRWIMPASGAITTTMLYAAIAPDAAFLSTFGETLPDARPAVRLAVRSWGILIALVGGALIYGAFVPAARTVVLAIAGISKAAFVALVLAHGSRYLSHNAGVSVAADAVAVLLIVGYFPARRGGVSPVRRHSARGNAA